MSPHNHNEIFEIMSSRKAVMKRPIQRIGGSAFSATWLPVADSSGSTQTACVVFDDTFQNQYSNVPLKGHGKFSDLNFSIELDGIPWPESVLSAEAYEQHVLRGEQLRSMENVFADVSASIDSFIAFDNSFASQRDLSDFLSCWTIASYATDVFDTVGYIWPSGEKGSGKTQCLKTIMRLAFMGSTTTSSSSFASIRDEACLGATIGFDDCENIQGMEQNKRELLLAGNTKGTFITLKVPGKRDGEWDTKRVDAFAPRGFTSIKIPDDVLGSRTIIVELVRSNDTKKTRRKPTNEKDWLVPPAQLRDEIWLNVVAGLSDIEVSKELANESSEIAGRDFDIFQGPLTVAFWLQELHGVEGLFDRMLDVMNSYHSTKHENQLPSLEDLVLQVVYEKLVLNGKTTAIYPTQEIVHAVRAGCIDRDITDESLSDVDAQQVGLLLSRLGFEKSASHGSRRSWRFTIDKLKTLAKSAGVELSSEQVAVNDNVPSDYTKMSSSQWTPKAW